MQRSVLTLSYDQQALPDLPTEALDLRIASRFFDAIGKEVDEVKLRSLGVFAMAGNRWVPSIGGLILFGSKVWQQQHIPDVGVRCARFLGDTKTHILDRLDVEGTILDAIDEVPKFIARNTRLAASFGSMQRQDIPEYPPVAVREALINAVAHADYSLRGSDIQIAIFADRLEIQNPGMFPFGFTLEDLKAGVSRIRNRVIVQVFHALQLVEKWGSGYKRIMDACRKGGYPEPKWEELGTTIRVTFYPHPLTVVPEDRKFILGEVDSLSQREMAILNLFDGNRPLPFREIHRRLMPTLSERMLRYELAAMKSKGLLISRGKGRSIEYFKRGILFEE
ncbi:MAG TPA: ATP-binding protein [Chlamydiales bacterium]|nr:ATP-binding protein [Chlamydiales bacterium]